MITYVIVEEFRKIVSKVSTELTAKLKIVDPLINAVHYDHGHPLEIIETLKQKDESTSFKTERYPIIALFQDFPENSTGEIGVQGEAILNVIIARPTDPNYKAAERYEKNFNPILYPIYWELMLQIHRSPVFRTLGATLIVHQKIDRLYWGRSGLYANQGNIFNDWLDCIEIKNLKLKVNQKHC